MATSRLLLGQTTGNHSLTELTHRIKSYLPISIPPVGDPIYATLGEPALPPRLCAWNHVFGCTESWVSSVAS
jgi:hypothetical protein